MSNVRINRVGHNESSIQSSRMKGTLIPLRLNELLGGDFDNQCP